ncbi:MAG: aminopeptidase, partial [Chlamydiia bacterium]|nr:aminopeptidase [Chlamydiia bacterium]
MAQALLKLSALKSAPKLQKNDLIVVPFTLSKGAKKPTALVSADLPEESLADFKGKFGEVLIVYVHGARTALLGLGDPDKLDDEKVRVAYGILVGKARTLQVKRILLYSADLVSSEAALEGALLASYTFEGYQSEKGPLHLSEVVWVGENGPSKNDLSRLYALAHGVFLARDLTNHNADDVTPQHLVHIARTLAKKYSAVKTTIFDKKRLEKEKFGLLLAVSRGAHVEPALIIASYKGNPKSKEHTVVVGKGVTYDTGGLNLKTNMLTMKGDMAGAAACLGLLTAAAEAKLKANFTIVIPSTENSIGERSYKPGDVYKSYLGKTV